jgi:hypothetical protein
MIDVQREIKRLSKLTVGELRTEHERVAGEPLRSNNRDFLTKRILWQLQACALGGLTERCRARARELSRESDIRMRPPDQIHEAVASTVVTPGNAGVSPAGSLITKVYRGRRLVVKVLDRGFEYEGTEYRSLSAIAQKVTGTKWNGRLFFGLTSKGEQA